MLTDSLLQARLLTDPIAAALAKRDAAELLARMPEEVEAARHDPVACINDFFWGVDREATPPRVFKAELWPWEVRYVNFLARRSGLYGGPYVPNDPDQIKLVLLKTRGGGATWSSVWFTTSMLWAHPHSQALFMSDTEEKGFDMITRHNDVRANLPASFPYMDIKPRGRDNLTVKEYDNGSVLISLSGDPRNIKSYHPTIIFVDEAAIIRADVMSALTGLKGDIVMLSTADGYGNVSQYDTVWDDAYAHGGETWGYVPLFVSWRERPDLRQRPKGSPQTIRQEYPETPEEAFQSTGENYFQPEAIAEGLSRHTTSPIRMEDDGCLSVWEDPDAESVYVLEVDAAKGKQKLPQQLGERGGRDYSVCSIREWMSGRQVACWHGRIAETQFAHKIFSLVNRYPGWIVVERPGPGEVVAERLMELCPERLHIESIDGKGGFLLTEQRRIQVLARLAQAILTYELPMRDRAFWTECYTFQRQKNGKVEANAGYHDDRIMATAIGEQVRATMAPPVRKQAKLEKMPDYRYPWDRTRAEMAADRRRNSHEILGGRS